MRTLADLILIRTFPLPSIFCSASYAAGLLAHNFFLADAIQQLHDEIDSCLLLLAFLATFLADTIPRIAFCTHNCIS